MKKISLIVLFVLSFQIILNAQTKPNGERRGNHFVLKNDKISFSLEFKKGKLQKETITSNSKWTEEFDAKAITVISDGDFAIDVVWAEWQAPGKMDNADNPVRFTKNDFTLTSSKVITMEEIEYKELLLTFEGVNNHLQLLITYHLPDGANYIRRKIKVMDQETSTHFLQAISPLYLSIRKNLVGEIIKEGGFGQPIAFQSDKGGMIYALEYPAANQTISNKKSLLQIESSQEIGQLITKEGVESNWAVQIITPNHYLKWWFYQYIDEIRVAKLRPYTLYNSWYDLRSPEYPKVPEGNVMNEKNIMHIIDLMKQNMMDKYDIHLDAFILDDGWDIYESDWKMRKETFPKGLKPISERLKKYGTDLGIWFGPTGGYSFRQRRIQWMFDKNYEVIGDPKDRDRSMLCIAGEKYGKLFRERTVDMVANQGVSSFKWDGIQFSCSDPTHGHPTGIYSRRAVMESVIDKCQAVRAANPKTFLNITSGTWLSPWWVQYANQIWMQGWDYAYSDAPSISKRDAAMTYRDYVLYDDFIEQKKWFPVANLMTHGIIKGNLQNLGGTTEPLDKFTNNALLYFARGVSMYELYISPDILNDAEWQAIAKSLKWAKDRFEILKNTFFIGGNPAQKEAYGYAHYKDDQGIIALRNPFIDKQKMEVKLDPALGLLPSAKNLVIEQVYPYHYIYPQTYSAGDIVKFDLDSYETAIFEIYPVEKAEFPLPAGAMFSIQKIDGKTMDIEYHDRGEIVFLNESKIENTTEGDPYQKLNEPKDSYTPVEYFKNEKGIQFKCNIPQNDKNIQIAILHESPDGNIPNINLSINNKVIEGKKFGEGDKWQWITYDIQAGEILGKIEKTSKASPSKTSIYLLTEEKNVTHKLKINFKTPIKQRSMPPEIMETGYVKKTYFVGEY